LLEPYGGKQTAINMYITQLIINFGGKVTTEIFAGDIPLKQYFSNIFSGFW